MYMSMLNRESTLNSYMDCKKQIQKEMKQYAGILWETSYEIRQLWLADILTDKQYNKLCDMTWAKN